MARKTGKIVRPAALCDRFHGAIYGWEKLPENFAHLRCRACLNGLEMGSDGRVTTAFAPKMSRIVKPDVPKCQGDYRRRLEA